MNTIKKSFTQFLISNNAWIVLVSLLWICFEWVMTFRGDFGWMVYMHPVKWILLVKLIGAFIVIFCPALLFCFFRTKLISNISSISYYILWIIVFIIYPIFLGWFDLAKPIMPVSMQPEVLWIIANMIVFVEIFTSQNNNFGIHIDFSIWKEKVSPEWIVISIFFVFSLFGTLQLIQTNHAEGSFLNIWIQNLLVLSVYYLFYLINHYFLVDYVYRQKGLIYYAFSFLALAFIFFAPLSLLYFYLPAFNSLLKYLLGTYWIGPNAPSAFWAIMHGTIFTLMVFTIPLTIFIQWFKQSNRIESLKKEKSETELNLLKQQINPHFFFNTLNNVYSMSLTKDEKTSEGILQLSDLMRYVIYKGQETTVKLKEEVKYIEDYIELQKLRLHQDFDVQFEKNIQCPNLQITPLLFIILVENAFKHGIEGAEEKSFLHISLNQTKNQLSFSCTNSIEEPIEKSEAGVGLKNLRRRLDLIYPNKHELILEKRKNEHTAILTIDL